MISFYTEYLSFFPNFFHRMRRHMIKQARKTNANKGKENNDDDDNYDDVPDMAVDFDWRL